MCVIFLYVVFVWFLSVLICFGIRSELTIDGLIFSGKCECALFGDYVDSAEDDGEIHGWIVCGCCSVY